jgi:antitoxin component of MazEF toxin-antitoxin module
MTTFTTAKVIAMVAVAVGGLAGRTISVTLQNDEKLNMSVKNFVLRSVAEQLKENAPAEEVEEALKDYDEVVMPSEDIMSVGPISGGHRRSRKTRRRHK